MCICIQQWQIHKFWRELCSRMCRIIQKKSWVTEGCKRVEMSYFLIIKMSHDFLNPPCKRFGGTHYDNTGYNIVRAHQSLQTHGCSRMQSIVEWRSYFRNFYQERIVKWIPL